jgi:hypothetical protein
VSDHDAVDPPRWFRYALPLVLARRGSRECFVGDLVEERGETLKRAEKVENKNLWYGRQLLSVMSHGRLTVMLALVVCITIVLSNGLLPLAGIDIPEFPGINIIFFGGIALAWTYAGFIAYRRAGVVADGSLAGAVSALVTMTAAMVTFALLQWDHAHLTAFELLPMFVLVGAIFGSLGSALARFTAPV